MIAKVSLTWIPAIFIIRHSQYRKELEIITNEMIEKVEKLATSSVEYNLDRAVSFDKGKVEGEIERVVEGDDRTVSIPSPPNLISYNRVTENTF